MPVPQIALLLAASLAAPAGGGAKPSVPAFDQNDVLGSIRRIRRSPTPEARAIARQIESGPHDLALQRAAARQDGMPLSPAQLEATTPPAALNAALVYAWLARVLEARPQDSRTLQIAGRLGAGRATTPDELAAVRKMREKRQDAIDLIHRATDRPRCAFRPDWSRGPPLLIREFSTLRAAARLLQAESFMQARAGRWSEAIATQARGFRVAEHAATDSFLIGDLIGIAIDRITLVGMENILYRVGPDAEVAERVQRTIAVARPHFDFRRTLEAETVYSLVTMEGLRRGGPQKMAVWLSLLEIDDKARKSAAKPRKLTAPEQRTWNRLIDAAEASYLQRLRRIIASVG